jgi:hypothetical protein
MALMDGHFLISVVKSQLIENAGSPLFTREEHVEKSKLVFPIAEDTYSFRKPKPLYSKFS